MEIDGSQCIDCQNCVEACNRQGLNYLQVKGSGSRQEITPSRDSAAACVYCGQCALHCPVSAAQEQTTWEAVEKLLQDSSKVVVAQFAPAVRVSIGEEFGLKPGVDLTKQINTSLKELGFKFIFDINFLANKF